MAVATADRALRSLEAILALPPRTDIERDASVQRFGYTFEATWKAARLFLLAREGVAASSPKAIVRACHSAGLLGDEATDTALVMVDDRNLTSHTYQEELAVEILTRLPDHARVLRQWVQALSAEVAGA